MTPSEKAQALLSLPRALSVDITGICQAIDAAMQSRMIGVTGDGTRDLARIETTPYPEGAVWGGFSAAGVQRLVAALCVEKLAASAEIQLAASKGSTNVTPQNMRFGETGPEIGNSILVARLLDTALAVLLQQGIVTVINTPYNERLRALYTSMGFDNGERLDLRNPRVLERALTYVRFVYVRHGLPAELERP